MKKSKKTMWNWLKKHLVATRQFMEWKKAMIQSKFGNDFFYKVEIWWSNTKKKYWITLIGNFQYERKCITIFFCWFELQSKHIIIIDTCLNLIENCYSKNNNKHITFFFSILHYVGFTTRKNCFLGLDLWLDY